MRLCGNEDLFGCAEVAEFLQNVANLLVVYSGQQLAVRKGARSARAELNVRLGVKQTEFFKSIIALGSAAHVVASVDDDRRVTVLRENQRAEKSRRSHTDHNGRRTHSSDAASYSQLRVSERRDAVLCSSLC